MQKIPQVVRERLQAGAAVGGHPDANVLTAFAEQSLPASERASVLEHLARCSDCREIVSLALPESETVLVVKVPSRGRLSWPAFRWAFITAGVAIVAVAAFQYQRLSQKPAAMMVAKQDAVEKVGTQPQTPPLPKAEPSAGYLEKDASRDQASAVPSAKLSAQLARPKVSNEEKRSLVAAPPPAVHAPAGSTLGGPVYGLKLPTQSQQQQQQLPARVQPYQKGALAKQEAGAGGALPPSSQMVEVQVQGEARPVTVESERQMPQNAASPTPKLAEPMFDSLDSAAVTKTKAAMEAVAPTNPRWSISTTGVLQRSFDQGGTWQDVDVNAGATGSADYAPRSTTELVAAARPRVKDGSSEKKVPGKEAGGPVFRAVTAIGPEVWAGGSEGALYHSVDAGNRWTRVVPSSGSDLLTGDVVAVEFSDTQHGTVTTSTAEVWSTGDNGRTWLKR